MKESFENNMFLSDIKNCQKFFNSTNTLAVVVTHEFALLWSNKETADNRAPNSKKCYTHLFDRDTPCEECPLSIPTATKPLPSIIEQQNELYMVETHPLQNNSGFFVLHHNVTSIMEPFQRLEKITESLPIGIVLTDSELQVEYASRAFHELFPFIPPPFLGKDLRLTVSRHSPPFPKSLLNFLFRSLKDPESRTSTLRFEVASPTKRYYDVICQSYNGNPIGSKNDKRLLFLFSDRTQEVTRQTILTQAEIQSKIDILFQQLSQKLTQGLNEIKKLASGFSSSAKDQLKATTTIKKIKTMRREAQELINLLEELNDYRKVGGDFGEVNVNTLLQKVIKDLEPQIKDREIKVRLHLTRYIKPLHADRKKLTKALEAILKNAIDGVVKKIPSSGEDFIPLVEVKTRMHGEIIEIQIKDNGEGIDREKIETLLDDKLFMSRAIIQSMGGTFELNSVKNVGTRVGIQIPSTPAVSQSNQTKMLRPTSKSARKQTTRPIFHGTRIWVLGQHDFAAEMIQNFLVKNGAQYKHIERPESLRKSLNAETPPDCLILNISDEKTAQPYIIQLKELSLLSKTTFAVPQELVPFLKRKLKGISRINYISKPFLMDALVETLTSCLVGKADR